MPVKRLNCLPLTPLNRLLCVNSPLLCWSAGIIAYPSQFLHVFMLRRRSGRGHSLYASSLCPLSTCTGTLAARESHFPSRKSFCICPSSNSIVAAPTTLRFIVFTYSASELQRLKVNVMNYRAQSPHFGLLYNVPWVLVRPSLHVSSLYASLPRWTRRILNWGCITFSFYGGLNIGSRHIPFRTYWLFWALKIFRRDEMAQL